MFSPNSRCFSLDIPLIVRCLAKQNHCTMVFVNNQHTMLWLCITVISIVYSLKLNQNVNEFQNRFDRFPHSLRSWNRISITAKKKLCASQWPFRFQIFGFRIYSSVVAEWIVEADCAAHVSSHFFTCATLGRTIGIYFSIFRRETIDENEQNILGCCWCRRRCALMRIAMCNRFSLNHRLLWLP